MKINLKPLCKRINYQFNELTYLKQALTHRSVGSANYERFEFLGDSILSFVIATELFNQFPLYSEGQLSRLRSYLVQGEMLTEIAKELDLGNFLFLGQGELKSGGFRRASILADALEALFAAVFLDGGITAATEVILYLFHSRLNGSNLTECFKDPKSQLQEYVQAEKYNLPEYTLIKVEGEEHDQVFYISCSIAEIKKATHGEGSNRRKAEQLAAKNMLDQLK